MTRTCCGWISCLSLAGLVACEAGEPVTLTTAELGEPYIGQQGRLLLGLRDPDVREFEFPSSIIRPEVSEDGRLDAVGMSGTDFAGVELNGLTGGQPISMRIAEVIKPDPDGPWQYALEQWDDDAKEWVQACAEPVPLVPPSSPPPPPTAVAMKGVWQADGLLIALDTAITFACRTGVAAKCRGWGYPVTKDPPDHTQTGHPSVATGPDMMLACTRMARADYCGQGLSNTLDGTPIHFYDAYGGPVPHNIDVPGFQFEAAWPAVAGNERFFHGALPALCLTKLRWSTLPLGGTCPLALPDPRIEWKGKFCEDMSYAELEAHGALLYSGSTYIDAGLYSYADAPTSAHLSTTNLLPGSVGQPPDWQVAPPPGSIFPQPGQPVRLEATIFSVALPPEMPRDDLPVLRSYQCESGDYLTTTSEPPAGCALIADEGHVYPPNTPGRTALRRWWEPNKERSFTTSAPATMMIADGWQLAEVVGGAVRGAMDVVIRWSQMGSTVVYSLDVKTRTGEWIAPCIDAAHIGTATSVVFRGSCAGGRKIGPADIAALRVNWAQPSDPFQSATRPYGGDADVHVDLPGGKATSLAVTWDDGERDASHVLHVQSASTGEWIEKCAGEEMIANGTSFVLADRCPSTGDVVRLDDISRVEVCRSENGGAKVSCGNAEYDGLRSSVEIVIP